MTPDTFNTWLQDSRGVEISDGTLRIAARDQYARDWLDNRLRKTVERTIKCMAGGLGVEFVVTA